MLKTLAIELSDERFFCGWQNFQHKQGRIATFAKDDAKIYHEEVDAEIDMKLLRKRGHRVTLISLDTPCAICGHSYSRHITAGGFCKHCTCVKFTRPTKRAADVGVCTCKKPLWANNGKYNICVSCLLPQRG